MSNPGPGEVPAAAAAPPPALLEVVEPPPRRTPILVAEASDQHFQDPAPAEPPKLYPPLPVSTDRQGRETLKLSRACALPESQREQKRTHKRFAMLAAALGKSISGPPENLLCARDRTVLQLVPTRPRAPLQPNQCARCRALGHWKNECLRQGRKRKRPQLWGLLTWKVNRAAGAQRYQVPESPW